MTFATAFPRRYAKTACWIFAFCSVMALRAAGGSLPSPRAEQDDLPPAATFRLGWDRFKSSTGFHAIAVAFDGSLLASGDTDGRVIVWDMHTGKRLYAFDSSNGTSSGIGDMMFSPDGTLITGSYDGNLKFWDVKKKLLLHAASVGAQIVCLMISPDGSRAAVGINPVTICDGHTGEVLCQAGSNGDMTTSLNFTPDSKTVISTGSDHVARFWDAHTGKQQRAINLGMNDVFMNASLSGDGSVLATTCGTVRLWNARTGRSLPRPRWRDGASVGSIAALSPAGTLLAASQFNVGVSVWDWKQQKLLHTFELPDMGQDCPVFSYDGKILIAFGQSHADLRMWDVVTGKRLLDEPARNNSSAIETVAVSPDGKWIVTGGMGDRVRLWDARTGEPRRTLKGWGDPAGLSQAMRFSPDGKTLFIEDSQSVNAWNLADLKLVHTFKAPTDQPVLDVCLSPDSTLLATPLGNADQCDVEIWSVETGQQLRRIPGQGKPAFGIAFNPTGDALAVSTRDQITLYDAQTLRVLKTILTPENTGGNRLRYSLDGRYVASDGNGGVCLWDAASGLQARTLKTALAATNPQQPVVVGAFDISPTGKLVAGAVPGGATVWDAETGTIIAELRGHDGQVNAVAFTPDGLHLVTGGQDTTALVWDLTKAFPAMDQDVLKNNRLWEDRLWRDLDSEDAGNGWAAVAQLSLKPQAAVAMLAERLDVERMRTPVRVDRALAALESIGTPQAEQLLKTLAAMKDVQALRDGHVKLEIDLATDRMETRAVLAELPELPDLAPVAGPASMPDQTTIQVETPVATVSTTIPTTEPDTVIEFQPARAPLPLKTSPPVLPDTPLITDEELSKKMADSGDWHVLPTFEQWLAEGADAENIDRGTSHLRAALEGLGGFADESQVRTLAAIYNNKTTDVTIRDLAAIAIARAASSASKDFLIDALNNPQLGETAHLQVAGALVKLDVDAGRDALIAAYLDCLQAYHGSLNANLPPRRELEAAADQKLIDRLSASLPKQTDEPTKNDIATMLRLLAVNLLPMDEVMKQAADENADHRDIRYHAIFIAGLHGGTETIQPLRDLRPWPTGGPADNPQEQKTLQDAREQAIAEIRRQHWAELVKDK